jgi:integrase/recombinase XerC
MCVSCLRISEALAIRFKDIECGRRSIFIPVTKNRDSRTVFMDVFTFEALNRYLDLERRNLYPNVDNVFIGFKGVSRGKALSVNAFQQLVRYYARKCGLPYLHSHLLRHVGITSLVKTKMPEPVIRKFVGHKDPKSLEPYLHLDTSYIEEEFERSQAAFTLPHVIRKQLIGGKS